jgi:hypothetical protein
MARGWESKAVEAQQDERQRQDTATGPTSPAERARLAERRTLELSLARAEADLAAATVPAHRAMLEQAIAALRDQLARR